MANYIREPYSADLDFGTGEWTASAWVNIPTTLPLSSFPVIGSELVVNGTFDTNANGWAGTATLVDGKLRITAVGGYTNVYQAISVTPGKVYVGYCSVVSSSSEYFFNITNTIGLNDYGGNASGQPVYFVPTVSTIYVVARVYGSSGYTDFDNISVREIGASTIVERAYTSGPRIYIGLQKNGVLTATAYDGTTTRTVTTTAAYNTATWAKAEACYTTDGTLSIRVNGQQVAATYGAPIGTLNNSNAVLTIGNSYNLDAPFPGSLALLKLSATVPTLEQSQWMYEQEKQMFREGAQVCLPDANAIVDLTYSDIADSWITASSTNTSYWTGLVRTAVTPVTSGSYSKLAINGGMLLSARSGNVDLTAPEKSFVKNLNKATEISAKNDKPITIIDYLGGFTANTTSLTNSATSVTSLSYPVSYVNTLVSSSALPTDTTIKSVNGTTVYFDKTATGSITAAQISFRDFILPVGYEARAVLVEGVVKREGSTADYTRLFDGFKETIRFAVAPGYNAKVQIQAVRSAT